jgi:hypothetical protein
VERFTGRISPPLLYGSNHRTRREPADAPRRWRSSSWKGEGAPPVDADEEADFEEFDANY